MSKKLKIISAKKDFHIESRKPFLDVTVEISSFDNEGILTGTELKKFGYEFGTSAEAILENLRKVLDVLIQEEEAAIKNIENTQLEAAADETIKQIEDISI